MSDEKNRNDNMQDYLDLLEKYGKIEEISEEIAPEEVSESIPEEVQEEKDEKRVKINNLSEEFNDDFFGDYDIDDESERTVAPPPVKAENKKKKSKIALWYGNLSKGKKIAVKIIAVLLAIIIALSAAIGIFIASKFSLMGDNINEGTGIEDDVIYEDEDFDDISVNFGSASFNQALRDWATTGNDSHMSSKNVINVLLIGADKKKNAGNTDVMMVVSVNKKTKELKLVSFFRDSYLYIEGEKSSYCSKLNAAYSMGGAETLIKTIENNYKIEIDNYVMVNFKSFEKIIDAMGGITVDVKKYEADYNYKKFKVTLPYGEGVTLNGKQALCFVRIRNCDADGDVSRTRRQRQVIEAMLDRVMNSSISELNKYIDVLLPYVDTGYSKTEILSLGLKALAGGWAKYERKQLQMPPADCRTSGSASGWIWVVDYQKAANILQTELYGSSNIVLSENRVSLIDIYKGAKYESNKNNDKSEETTKVPGTTAVTLPATEPVTEIEVPTTENNDVVTTTEAPTEAPTQAPQTTQTQTTEAPPQTEPAGDTADAGTE